MRDMRTQVSSLFDAHIDCRTSMLTKWKEKTVAWNTLIKHVFRYIKNPAPVKFSVVMTDQGPTNHPYDIDRAPRTYWNEVESWPAGVTAQDALVRLEETFSILLPRVHFDQALTPFHLREAAKYSKPSAPGMDAWTCAEIKALPILAWESFLESYHGNDETIQEPFLNQLRRTPFEKKEGVCSPHDIRPIDLYSGLIRTCSSATYGLLKGWAKQVLHQQPFASQGGILLAISKFGLRIELSTLGHTPAYSISVDFAKMFNMLSHEVAQVIASYMDSLIILHSA